LRNWRKIGFAIAEFAEFYAIPEDVVDKVEKNFAIIFLSFFTNFIKWRQQQQQQAFFLDSELGTHNSELLIAANVSVNIGDGRSLPPPPPTMQYILAFVFYSELGTFNSELFSPCPIVP
jgi:hypothetical protein